MVPKISAATFGMLSRLKTGDAIHFKANVDGETLDCVIVVLSGDASGEMVLSDCAATPSYETDGSQKWTLCTSYGLVGSEGCGISWIPESVSVEVEGGLDQAKKYTELLLSMSSLSDYIGEVKENLKSKSSTDLAAARQFCFDMVMAHGDDPITTISIAAWMLEHLPKLPTRSAQVAVVSIIFDKFCRGEWTEAEGSDVSEMSPPVTSRRVLQ